MKKRIASQQPSPKLLLRRLDVVVGGATSEHIKNTGAGNSWSDAVVGTVSKP
jgi:hypothetical protein